MKINVRPVWFLDTVSPGSLSSSPACSLRSISPPRIDVARSCASPAVLITNVCTRRRAPPAVVSAAHACRCDGFVQKATAGLASAVAFFILGLGGWVTIQADSFAELQAHNVTQPDSALAALWITVTLIPALGALACAGVLSFYRLRDADAALMAKCNAGEITREECEAQLSRVY